MSRMGVAADALTGGKRGDRRQQRSKSATVLRGGIKHTKVDKKTKRGFESSQLQLAPEAVVSMMGRNLYTEENYIEGRMWERGQIV